MSRIFQLDITLTEPTILTDGSSDSAGGHETLLYIPGSSVLGALVGALGVSPSDPGDLFSHTFLSPRTRFLNAYPVTRAANGDTSTRTLPRPLTFKHGKTSASNVIDGLDSNGSPRTIEELRNHFAESSDHPKSGKSTFIIESAPGSDWSPQRNEQVHVGIDRATRAAQDGVLFTYESMPRGTAFRSMIITDEETVAVALCKVISRPLTLRIGRSRSAGYGSASAKLTEVADADAWSEVSGEPRRPTGNTVLTLLSDYVPHLESLPSDALCTELVRLLGVARDTVQPRATSTRTVRGFRGVWGLPRPARTALAKGSVIVINGALDSAKLAEVVQHGIGARTNEGFGRITANWGVLGAKSGAETGVVHASGSGIARASVGTVQLLAAINIRKNDRLTERFVERVLANPKTKAVVTALARVPRSQLGNLRSAVTGSLTMIEIGTWFKGISEKTAGTRWKKVSVPTLSKGDTAKSRNGIGFVWTSLLGGTTADGGKSDNPSGEVNFEKAIERSFAPLLGNESGPYIEAAKQKPDRTVRLIISALCSEVVRADNAKRKSELTTTGNHR